MKTVKHSGLVAMAIGMMALAGCGQALKSACQYEPGQSERVRISQDKLYKIWVEMPGNPPTPTITRQEKFEIVLLREVESVEPDGSAIMKITVESIDRTLNIESKQGDKSLRYLSTADKTQSGGDWRGEPKLAGAAYKIRITPKTLVTEIIGLEELRAQLNLKEDAAGPVAAMLTEKEIKRLHERLFLQDSPAKIDLKKGYEKLVPIPDATIKAKGVRKTYTISQTPSNDDQQRLVTMTSTGQAAHTVPEDFVAGPVPTNMFQKMIVETSEMDELIIKGQGVFDAAAGSVRSETNEVKCTLILDGSSLTGQFAPGKEGGSGGEMFTFTHFTDTFEVLPYSPRAGCRTRVDSQPIVRYDTISDFGQCRNCRVRE